MQIRFPNPTLARFVDRLWINQPQVLPHTRERVLPTGCANLIVMLDRSHLLRPTDAHGPASVAWRGGVLQGAFDRPFLRDTSRPTSAIGVQWRPGALPAVLVDRADLLTNRPVSLEDVFGAQAEILQDRLHAARDDPHRLDVLEQWLTRRLAAARPVDAMVQRVLARLAAAPFDTRIGDLQRDSGCSTPTFIRRFREAVGLTPKRYARVLRLSALLRDVAGTPRIDWAHSAAASGYADQAHLTHEFRRLAGLTPARYRAVAADRPQHVALC